MTTMIVVPIVVVMTMMIVATTVVTRVAAMRMGIASITIAITMTTEA
jgi:hypothetical protein